MRKPRKAYIYVARRIDDPTYSQNLGDFAIIRRLPDSPEGHPQREHYHYASEDYPVGEWEFDRRGRIVNRGSLQQISRGSRIYAECIKAVERLIREEEA